MAADAEQEHHVPLKRPSRAGDSVIPRQELIGDRRRADTSYQQLKALRRNTVQWLVAEAGPQREAREGLAVIPELA